MNTPCPRLLAVVLAMPLALLAACGGADSDGVPGTATSTAAIEVAASDDSCRVSTVEAPAGTIAFNITNEGSKVTEFYLYAEGDRIMGEAENIGPGISRELHIEVAEGGTYETVCKPGMVGDGIRAAFTVTGSAGPAVGDDAKLAEATASYARYVASQTDALLEQTQAFVDAVKAGDVERAKALFPISRTYWERIEPVAGIFGDLDPMIDGREDVVADGMDFTGYHRLERDLWQDGLQSDSGAIADKLMTDVTEVVRLAGETTLNPLQLANGSKGLLDEVATGKVTGEEDRYSHTDLYDFRANIDGSQAAIAALRPVLVGRDPDLVATIEARFDDLDTLLESHRSGDGFVPYDELTADEVAALAAAVDAVSEPVSQVAAVVAAG